MAIQTRCNGSSISYDDMGNPIQWKSMDLTWERGRMLKTSGGSCYYLHNHQNDIVGLIGSTGIRVVSYCYDSWGRPLGMTDSTERQNGSKNLFRYWEYFYDAETKFYYVFSRYYDLEVGRFISADGEILDGTYCQKVYQFIMIIA